MSDYNDKMHTNTVDLVSGYNPVSSENIAKVNTNKIQEELIIRRCEALGPSREASIAITKFQEAYMWLNRAIFKPSRITLVGDKPIEDFEIKD